MVSLIQSISTSQLSHGILLHPLTSTTPVTPYQPTVIAIDEHSIQCPLGNNNSSLVAYLHLTNVYNALCGARDYLYYTLLMMANKPEAAYCTGLHLQFLDTIHVFISQILTIFSPSSWNYFQWLASGEGSG